MHILSPETDNCPSWISWRERMAIENISWSISTKECCWPQRGLNPRPPGLPCLMLPAALPLRQQTDYLLMGPSMKIFHKCIKSKFCQIFYFIIFLVGDSKFNPLLSPWISESEFGQSYCCIYECKCKTENAILPEKLFFFFLIFISLHYICTLEVSTNTCSFSN